MSLMERFVRPGMPVQLLTSGDYRQAGGEGIRFSLVRGQRFTVSRVYSDNTVMVRTVTDLYLNGRMTRVSFRIGRVALDEYDPNGPGPRKLGQKPDDTADMTYIGTDHPGIQWLWEDLHTYASGKGWCDEFDRLAREVNIPGRMEEFEIEVSIPGGGTYVTDIRAHSEEEAEKLAREELMRGLEELARLTPQA